MLILFAIYLLTCLYGIKLHFKSNYDYLSKDVTTSVKGIFILMVFFSHFNSYAKYTNYFDKLYTIPFFIISQGMVTLFLFYSGFGVMEQIKRRDNYVSTIPVNRILSTLFQFSCAVILYALLNVAINEPFTFKTFSLSLIGWETLGNSNWYIFIILCMYAITYISFRIFSQDYKKAAFFNLIATIIYIIVMRYIAHKPLNWHDTVLLYPLGIFWSIYRLEIEKTFKNNTIYVVTVIIAILAFFIIDFRYLKNILFALAFLLFTFKIQIGNRILNWCGRYLFEIYILQRIPMIILKHIGFMDVNLYISFLLSLLITVILAVIFKKYIFCIWRYIIKKVDL